MVFSKSEGLERRTRSARILFAVLGLARGPSYIFIIFNFITLYPQIKCFNVLYTMLTMSHGYKLIYLHTLICMIYIF